MTKLKKLSNKDGIVDDELVFHSVTEELIEDTKQFLDEIRSLK